MKRRRKTSKSEMTLGYGVIRATYAIAYVYAGFATVGSVVAAILNEALWPLVAIVLTFPISVISWLYARVLRYRLKDCYFKVRELVFKVLLVSAFGLGISYVSIAIKPSEQSYEGAIFILATTLTMVNTVNNTVETWFLVKESERKRHTHRPPPVDV